MKSLGEWGNGIELSEEDVLAHCAETLPDFKRPARIYLTDAILKNDRGKIDRNALSEAWKRSDLAGKAPI